MVEFIKLVECAEHVAVVHALKSIGNDAPDLSDDDITAIATFNSTFLRLKLVGKRLNSKSKPLTALGFISERRNTKPMPHAAEMSKQPIVLKELLTAIEVADGANLETARVNLKTCLSEGRLRSFLIKEEGVPERFPGMKFASVRHDPKAHFTRGNYWDWPWFGFSAEGSKRLPIAILKDDYDYWMQHGQPKPDSLVSPSMPPKSKGGAKPKYNWSALIEHGVFLLQEFGKPSPDDEDPNWRSQNHLIERLQQWYLNKYGEEPSTTSVKEHIPKIYESYKQNYSSGR